MANNTQEKRVVVEGTTPVGIAIYPKLFEPDYKWKEEGEYSVKLKLEADAAQPLIDKIEGLIDAEFAKAEENCKNARDKAKLKRATPCYEAELDEDGNETGHFLFRFKKQASGISKKDGAKWKSPLTVFDGKMNQITTKPEYQVWSGSKVRVAYALSPFSTNIGVGCSCRLNACQIVVLATGQSKDARAYGFGEEADGFDNSVMNESASFGQSVRDTDTEVDNHGADNDGDF